MKKQLKLLIRKETMASINKMLMVACVCILASCDKTGGLISNYMESSIDTSCSDTTFWKIVDLQEVLEVDYDELYIIGSDFEEDIRNTTQSDWNGGDYMSDENSLLLLIKDNKVVYKDEVDKSMIDFYAFDRPFQTAEDYVLKDTSTIYNVRVDITNSKKHYYFYNKDRMDKGMQYEESYVWFRKGF